MSASPAPALQLRARSLQQTLVSAGVLAAIVALTVVSLLAWRAARSYLARDADARMADIAQRSAALVGLYLRERRAELELVASDPAVAAGAQAADADAARRGLANLSPEQLERTFAATHSLTNLGSAGQQRVFVPVDYSPEYDQRRSWPSSSSQIVN